MARHIYHCAVRWSDMDAYGHVNNVVFVRYLEEARVDLLFRVARAANMTSFSEGSVVARHEIDYVKPLFHRPEPVVVETWVTRITAATATLAYEIRDADQPLDTADTEAAGSRPGGGTAPGEVYVRAKTMICPYDLAAQKPRRVTDEEREFLERYLDDGPPGVRAKRGDGSGALVA